MYSQHSLNTHPSIKVRHTLYCKVCADSKKPMSIVTSHNVRNLKNGAVTCPTLLEQSCRQCGQRGHTVSRCKQAPQKAEEPVSKKTKRDEPVKKKNVTFSFDVLMSDSEDERDLKEEVKEVKGPQFCVPAKPLLTGYASALNTEPTISTGMLRRQPEDNYTVTRGIPKLFEKPAKDPNRPFSWADCSSESEGSEEEDN